MVRKRRLYAYMHTLWRVFGFLGPQRSLYVVGSFMSVADMGAKLIVPYILQEMVLVAQQDVAWQIPNTIVLFGVLLALLVAMASSGNYVKQKAAAIGLGNMRKQVFAHIQRLPVSQAMERQTGDYIMRMTNDVDRAGATLQGFAITSLFRFIVLFTSSAVLMLIHDWRMMLVGVMLSLLMLLASTFFNPRIRILEQRAQETASNAACYLLEAIRGMAIIRIFGLQDYLSVRFAKSCSTIFTQRVRFRLLGGVGEVSTYLLGYSAQIIGLFFGVYFTLRGEMQASTLVFTYGMIGIMADSMRSLNSFIQYIQGGLVSAQRVFELLDTPEEEQRETLKPANLKVQDAIVVRNITFAYPGGMPILNNLCLSIRRGEVVAIVGDSGGGKTTLFKLIQDFYSVDKGQILLFDSPIHELSRSDVRALSAYVPQECILFDATISENIRWGNPKCNWTQMEQAAKQACLHDFIMTLPDEYNTSVGAGGTHLSGGQRQRVAIARALIKDAPLLLLDEATAALDSESEEGVLLALGKLMQGRTTLVIAHRLSTIQNADYIVVLEKGQISEIGNHEMLLARGGRYKQLFDLQFELRDSSVETVS